MQDSLQDQSVSIQHAPTVQATSAGDEPRLTVEERHAQRRLWTQICREGRRLLHAQCWAWGKDIKRAEGNLLLEHGFERLRPPAGRAGCSQYTLPLENGHCVRLWGFGVYVGQLEGIYLNRFEFLPRHALLADAWSPEVLARGLRTVDVAAVARLTRWVAGYEGWVAQCAGAAWRAETLSGWGPDSTAPFDLSQAWLQLHELVEQASALHSAV